MRLTVEKLADWLVPVLLAGAVHTLIKVRDEVQLLRHDMLATAARVDKLEEARWQLKIGP